MNKINMKIDDDNDPNMKSEESLADEGRKSKGEEGIDITRRSKITPRTPQRGENKTEKQRTQIEQMMTMLKAVVGHEDN
ncbi:hypothetical protein Zmor_018844 [Zophobas morio]|uniref:Uncharacterized protein n=1 Tax=Zophobas morio TaxID=2755281 RepID=A0AA38IAT2_9CUCU|nr:hypothetical protein Zmor_018844 [Zophobas morio]